MTTDDHMWLTIPEAARELRVSVATVWRWIRAGRLAATRVGVRSIRVRRSDLAGTQQRVQPSSGRIAQGRPGDGQTAVEVPPPRSGIPLEELLLRMSELRERILARRGGVPLPDSAEAIREAREERYDDL